MVLVDELRHLQNEMLNDLEYIVNMDTATSNKPGVDKLGQWVKERFLAMDWQVKEYKQKRVGNTIIARKEGKIPGQIGIFVHLDTAHPQGITREWIFEIEGDRATGPGVIDMKGGLITGIYALENLDWTKSKSVEIVFNGEEEIGSPDSNKYLQEVARRSEVVLTLEPARPDGSMVTSRRGAASFKLSIQGASAHALNEPEKGRSAVLELAHKIIELESLGDRQQELNINVGIVRGGEGSGTAVPAKACSNFFVGFRRQQDYEECLQKIEEICQRQIVPDTVSCLKGGIVFPAMEKVPETEEIIMIVKGVAGEMGLQVGVATGGSSDAGFATAVGTPVLCGLGPVGGKLHTRDEYLEVSSLIPRTVFFINILTSISEKYQA